MNGISVVQELSPSPPSNTLPQQTSHSHAEQTRSFTNYTHLPLVTSLPPFRNVPQLLTRIALQIYSTLGHYRTRQEEQEQDKEHYLKTSIEKEQLTLLSLIRVSSFI